MHAPFLRHKQDQSVRSGSKRGTDVPHSQGRLNEAMIFVFSSDLHSGLFGAINARRKEEKGQNLDNVERMGCKGCDGTSSSGRAAVERCRSQMGRRKQY
jgi:hypothetical protein